MKNVPYLTTRKKTSNNMQFNILITGSKGQLGNEMRKILKGNDSFNTFYTDIEELDISNRNVVEEFIITNKIDYIINCAAYTAVDLAEDNIEIARTINHMAVENLGIAAHKAKAKVIHVSTDYVFDGTSCHPYSEEDSTNPQSVYGTTKLDGEKVLAKIIPNDHIIIRTAWLYSIYGKNFVKTMLNLGKTKDCINVVADQIGTPTYAGDLANAIYQIISSEKWIPGIYHFTNEGVCSWYDFTKTIHKIAGITNCIVQPISTEEYPSKAKRPAYSVLNKSKIKQIYGIKIPYWVDSLEKCINELNQDLK